ncbi:hypothetical protein ACWEWX_48700, partial [Streptomyces asiaticus]
MTTTTEAASTEAASTEAGRRDAGDPRGGRFDSSLGLLMLLLVVVVAQGPVRRALSAPVAQSWMTVFTAVVLQALPFLVLGVLLSALIAVFVPPSFFARAQVDHRLQGHQQKFDHLRLLRRGQRLQ